jgi:orotate phosphoribosyltransferase
VACIAPNTSNVPWSCSIRATPKSWDAAWRHDTTGPQPIRVVASPAIGGLIIGHEVARALGARFIFTERDPLGKMTLRRGFAVTPGETAVVVEDVVTTGGSTREVVEILQREGASTLAAASIIDRSGGGADVGIPRVALATLQVIAHEAAACRYARKEFPWPSPARGRVDAVNAPHQDHPSL